MCVARCVTCVLNGCHLGDLTYVITNHCINFVKKIERLYVISFSFIVVAMHIKCVAVAGDDGHHALQDSSVPCCSLGWQFT